MCPGGKESDDPTRGGSITTTDDDDGDSIEDLRSGVLSEADGSLELALASRLHTGQNVLHELNHESTQAA